MDGKRFDSLIWQAALHRRGFLHGLIVVPELLSRILWQRDTVLCSHWRSLPGHLRE